MTKSYVNLTVALHSNTLTSCSEASLSKEVLKPQLNHAVRGSNFCPYAKAYHAKTRGLSLNLNGNQFFFSLGLTAPY